MSIISVVIENVILIALSLEQLFSYDMLEILYEIVSIIPTQQINKFQPILSDFQFFFAIIVRFQVLRMCCSLFHGGPESGGVVASGGTEALLLACIGNTRSRLNNFISNSIQRIEI